MLTKLLDLDTTIVIALQQSSMCR